MKRIALALGLIFTVLIFPVSASALKADDPDFEAFLKKIGWDKQDYIDYLHSKDWGLKWYDSVDELGIPITEQSVQTVLKKHQLTRAELNDLLVEFGDIEPGEDVLDSEWIIFEHELFDYVDYYASLDAITAENLLELLDYYGFASKKELEDLLNEYGDSLDYYGYIQELYDAVDFYLYDNELQELFLLFEEIGLTEDEFYNLYDHLMNLAFEDDTFTDRLLALSDRMEAIADFESLDDLTAEQIAELLSIFNELVDLAEIEPKYYLVKGDEKKPISFQTLLEMTTTDGYDLLIEIYNLQGDFLADILLTAELFGSEVIKETGKDLKEVVNKPKKAHEPVNKTVKGGKLPNTATNNAENVLIGLGIATAGFLLLRRFKTAGN